MHTSGLRTGVRKSSQSARILATKGRYSRSMRGSSGKSGGVVLHRGTNDVTRGRCVVLMGDLDHRRTRVPVGNLLVGEKVMTQTVDNRPRHLGEVGVPSVRRIGDQHPDQLVVRLV